MDETISQPGSTSSLGRHANWVFIRGSV